ncbi:Phycoerythrin linker protein CpeS homolog [Richelia intracellularis HH01]|uniref:Chromophore lyase CpcS/CpeS n=1 Tax=Richelia intracellularis HH01 TaxID=1165094 RepID=M1WQN4_9NOST|nr:phycobiliprotein lyase [Richelia intracellularis]CCH66484.1 Phycoerythrin linker protein CpeS homolog [Richelia intracellularis HH01]
MNIEEFFELSAGKWFAHRTYTDLISKTSEEGKSELIIKSLPIDHPGVIQVCQKYQFDPKQATCSAKLYWDDITKLNQKKTGSMIIVLIPSTESPLLGKFLHQIPESNVSLHLPGSYKIGEDEALTLYVRVGNTYLEERLWFASPNLRMRVSVAKNAGGVSYTSFTSEIRMSDVTTK